VFQGLAPSTPAMPMPARFVIRARHYLSQTLVTDDITLPNPTAGVPPNVVVVKMLPRTGYPFSPTLTRVVGLVRVGASVDSTMPPIPDAVVTLTAVHTHVPTPPPVLPPVVVNDPPVTVTTTEDGQYTYWFFPEGGGVHPPLANGLSVTVQSGALSKTITLNHLIRNGVTYAPTVFLP
jgi:hypothetical protein